MKTTLAEPYRQEIPLPTEVVELIAIQIGQIEDSTTRQRSLWAACLQSKVWYVAAVKQLYKKPLLVSRNFDLFVRTLCPPVASHTRKVGLEKFVKDLHLGHLAYESSKSLTARLLRRVQSSLESFTSPAISFSSTSLQTLRSAPRLQALDLSSDSYGLTAKEVLQHLKHLGTLRTLAMPQNIRLEDLVPSGKGESIWPPNLEILKVNSHMEDLDIDGFLSNLPRPLRSLSFPRVATLAIINIFDNCSTSVPQVLHVSFDCISTNGIERVSLRKLLQVFPSVATLAVPAMMIEQYSDIYSSNTPFEGGSDLKELVILSSLHFGNNDWNIHGAWARAAATLLPKLMLLEVPTHRNFIRNFESDPVFIDQSAAWDKVRVVLEERRDGARRGQLIFQEPWEGYTAFQGR